LQHCRCRHIRSYTIVLLPAIILALAYSIELFKLPLLKYLLTGLFVCLSLINLLFVKKYYTALSKTQFREMTEYVVHENTGNFPVLNESTAWHQQYYLTALGSHAKVYAHSDSAMIDSILNKRSERYKLEGFWIVGAHVDAKPSEKQLKALDTAYALVKQKDFYDAWALFYRSKLDINNDQIIAYNDFIGGNSALLADKHQIAVWSGAIKTKPVSLKKGRFKVSIAATGSPALGIYPHLNIYMNGKKIAGYFVTGNIEVKSIDLDIPADTDATFTIEMDNDLQVPPNQDRNFFVQYLAIRHSPR
jgi:Ca-dependent carbohydrate-binding module xylan-binding